MRKVTLRMLLFLGMSTLVLHSLRARLTSAIESKADIPRVYEYTT